MPSDCRSCGAPLVGDSPQCYVCGVDQVTGLKPEPPSRPSVPVQQAAAPTSKARRHNYMAVVGESHYQETLRAALARYGRQQRATLEPEPSNTYDANAVVVKIDGLTVGYLSRDVAKRFVSNIAAKAPVNLPSELVGGDEDRPSLGLVLDFEMVYDSMEQTLKRCPFCAEEIQFAAIVCKHCSRDLRSGLPAPGSNQPTQQRLWSPGVAAVLSLVIPGAGQMYKGNVGSGIVWLIAVVIGYALLIFPGLVLHIVCIVNATSGDPYKQ